MRILVSGHAGKGVRQALGSSGILVKLSYDLHIFTEVTQVAIELKTFPGDFTASAVDGRLAREIAAMKQGAPVQVLLLQGKAKYDAEGNLITRRRKIATGSWTRQGIRNLIRSVEFAEGVMVEHSDNLVDTVRVLEELYHYFNKEQHVSMYTRQGPKSNEWFTPTYRERFLHWIQGCGEGVKAVRAIALAKEFRTPVDICNASAEDLMKVSGIGKVTAQSIHDFLRGQGKYAIKEKE